MIYDDQSKESIHLKVNDGFFLSAHHDVLGGFAISCHHDAIDSEVTELVVKLVNLSKGKVNEFKIKLVGKEKLIRIASDTLRNLSVGVAASKVQDDPFEVIFYPKTGRVRLAAVGAAEPIAATVNSNRKIRVLIIDDSKTICDLLSKVFSIDPKIEVVGTIQDPMTAEMAIKNLKPDVITLDIHMPRMDGVQLLKRYMRTTPVPTVMITSISKEEGPEVFRALEFGAVDYIQKPTFSSLEETIPAILEKVHTASKAKVTQKAEEGFQAKRLVNVEINKKTIVFIGSSTGGTEALKEVFIRLPENIPPMMVVQHIPALFSNALAKRLNDLCPFEVKEAEEGDEVRANRILIAPGGQHMKIEFRAGKYVAALDQSPPLNHHRPAVDILFDSAAQLIGDAAIGVVLTGMGSDGAVGLSKMKKNGARTIAQDEATSVVYGMPGAAVKAGAVDEILGLEKIPLKLVTWFTEKK